MDRVFEFIGNHPYLISAFVGLLLAFIYTEMQRGGRRVSPTELSRLANKSGARVIDIRNAPEFRDGHITGSEHIAFSQIANDAKAIAEQGKPVVIVCSLGHSAGQAARTIKQAGLQEVYVLEGGISGWRQQGLPLVK